LLRKPRVREDAAQAPGARGAEGEVGPFFYFRFLFALRYDGGAARSRFYLGVDFESSNSLVLQDPLGRIRPSHFLDFTRLRVRASGRGKADSLLCVEGGF
jgi:hypothetical protein